MQIVEKMVETMNRLAVSAVHDGIVPYPYILGLTYVYQVSGCGIDGQ